MRRIFSREGAESRVSGFFFKYVIQSVLLFGAEKWVVTPRMGRVLGSFQEQVAQRLAGRIPWRRAHRNWDYTPEEAARGESGCETMEAYIWQSQNTVAQYSAMQSLLNLCKATERMQGEQVGTQWW